MQKLTFILSNLSILSFEPLFIIFMHIKKVFFNSISAKYSAVFFCCAQLLSRVLLFVNPWTVAHQAPYPGIFQARILEWVAIFNSRRSSQPRDQTCIYCIGMWVLYYQATREAHSSISGVSNFIFYIKLIYVELVSEYKTFFFK